MLHFHQSLHFVVTMYEYMCVRWMCVWGSQLDQLIPPPSPPTINYATISRQNCNIFLEICNLGELKLSYFYLYNTDLLQFIRFWICWYKVCIWYNKSCINKTKVLHKWVKFLLRISPQYDWSAECDISQYLITVLVYTYVNTPLSPLETEKRRTFSQCETRKINRR